MEHYLSHTDYPIWEVIQKGNGPVSVSINANGVIKELPPKTTEEILARERERKARTTLLMALPEDHLAKFHKMTDAKEMWDAIKSRFGSNDESKKMHKYILKQQFEGFSVSNSEGLHKDHEDLEQLDEFDLEEMDLKWQVAMISMRLKKFYKKTGRRLQFDAKEPISFNKTKVECFNFHNIGHFARECRSKGNQESRRRDAGNTGYRAKDNRRRLGKQEEPKALVTLDGEVAHQKNQLWYEEKIRFMKTNLDDKTDVLTYHKKLLAEAIKEKEELKTKLENFQSSSKGLSKLLNSQMSTRDKYGHGYEDQVHNGVLNYENEVFQSVFDNRLSDVEDSPVHDRFANVERMHAVPPPITRNYMPPGPDREVDDYMFTSGLKQSKTSESDTQTSNFDSCESNSSVETLKYMPESVVVKPKVVSQPKVWSDGPIIEEYESDSDDEYVIQPSKEQEKPSFAFFNTVKHVKTHRETIKEQNTYSPSLKADKRDWNGLMSKRLGLGYGFTKKACFVLAVLVILLEIMIFMRKEWLNRHQELASPEQTTSGKDFSNPLIVDSLLKTIWLSIHHVIAMKHWLFQGKRQLVKNHQIY
ncbi:ribonuclease H-like domain-containing protein [Tanacetum coccineum]